MKRICKDTKRLEKIESFEIKTKDSSCIRVLYDTETKLVELIVDHALLSNCNQGVKSNWVLERDYQPYVLVRGFHQD